MREKIKIKTVVLLAASLLLFLMNLAVGASNAPTEGTCGSEAEWSFEGKTLTVSGSGPMDDFGKAPWHDFRHKIHQVVVKEGITRIGNNAFYDCLNLQEAVLTDSVTSIGDMAFYGCFRIELRFPKGLTDIGVYAFYDCKLTEIDLPDGLLHIHQMAFAKSSTKKVVLPDSIQTIGLNVFDGCKSLKEVRYKGTREQWVDTQIYANDELFRAGIRFDGDLFKLLPAGIAVLIVFVGGAIVIFRKKRKKYANL